MAGDRPRLGFSEIINVRQFRLSLQSFQNRERGCDVAGDFSLDGIDLEPLRQIPPARPDVRRGRRSVVEVRTNEPVNVVDTECELVSYQLKTHEKDGVRAVVDTTEMTNAVEESEKMVSKNDIVLQVAVYNSEKPHKSQEFLVLGSQPLTQLRDKIHCLGDEIPSEFPKVKAGFFFMEDTFYRSSEGEDYSTGIAEFLEHHRNEWKVTPKRWRRSSGRLKEERIPVVIHDAAARAAPSVAYDYLQFKSMTETFEHLHIRLGYPYVYVHLVRRLACILPPSVAWNVPSRLQALVI